MCIDRQIITCIKKNTNNKAMVLNDAINLDDGKEYLFRDNTDIEGSFINKEDAKEFINLICDSLSDIEKKVFSFEQFFNNCVFAHPRWSRYNYKHIISFVCFYSNIFGIFVK